MSSTPLQYTVLVVADSNFNRMCVDPKDYLTRLHTVLHGRIGDRLDLRTIDSKYGLLSVNPDMAHFVIEDKNKTSFVQTVENVAGKVDELLVISVVDGDPFLTGLMDSLGRTKTVTRYSYVRK